MRFREHRGGLTESMKTLVELPDRATLVSHCKRVLEPLNITFASSDLKIEPYSGPDLRIDWENVYVVTLPKVGVVGFTDTAC